MNAHANFASRFTDRNLSYQKPDTMELLWLLQEMSLQNAAPNDDHESEAPAPAPAANGSQSADQPKDAAEPSAGDQSAGDQSAGDQSAGDQSAPEQSASKPKSDRENNGRFAKGNQLGTGNPHARQVAALRKQLLDSMTPFVFQQAIEALVLQACTGDVAALKLLFQYTLGKPAEAVNPDRVALDEAELLSTSNKTGRQWRDLCGAPFLETVMDVARFAQSMTNEKFEGRFMARASEVVAAQEKERQQSEARRARAEARRAQKAAEAAVAAEAGAASQATPNSAGPGGQPAAAAPSSNGFNGQTAAIDPRPAQPNAPQPPTSATAPSANGPIGSVPERQAAAATPPPRDAAPAAAAPAAAARPAGDAHPPDDEHSVNPAVNPASAADRVKTKAPPSTNGAHGRPAAPPKSVPGVPRSARSAKRKTRAA